MRIVCIFTDKPEMNEHRKRHSSAHLAYLAEHESEILIGGGLRNEPGGKFVGGMWVLEVDSFERAKQLVENDPYYISGMRHYSLKIWGKAFDKPVTL